MLEWIDARKAQAFGLPAQNMDYATALQILAEQGFDERAANAHLQDAIAAGAFRPSENQNALTAQIEPSEE